jgi:hypothetical protein
LFKNFCSFLANRTRRRTSSPYDIFVHTLPITLQ